MKINRLRIENFSCFIDTGWIEFDPGLNVVIGQNNSGKSSLLQAISFSTPIKTHRNNARFLNGDMISQRISIDLHASSQEFTRRLSETGVNVQTVLHKTSQDDLDTLRQWLLNEDGIIFPLQNNGGGLRAAQPTFDARIPAGSAAQVNVHFSEGLLHLRNAGESQSDSLASVFDQATSPSLFNFPAQRLNIASSPFAVEHRLAPDARNLPGVLAFLFGNHRYLFEEIEERVKEVIPSVGAITVTPEFGNFTILLWPDKSTRFRELAFDLNDSGTGVAQVIALVTAIVTSYNSVIVVDEINSFLHPAAVKKLLQICTTFYPYHQYIISSHSADVISSQNVSKIMMVEKDGFVSSVSEVPPANVASMTKALHHLGVAMMDVLGSDHIVWVEGPTEEIAFPMISQRLGHSIPPGMTFTAVAATGDFSRRGKSKKAVVELYEAATTAAAPLVRGSSFVLDRETLSDDAVSKIERGTDGRLLLLPRRCLECYAIFPEYIAEVINKELDQISNILPSMVESEIFRLATDVRYGGASKWNGMLDNEEWLKRVDGASILDAVFSSVTGHKLSFRKTVHTPQILSLVPLESLKGLGKLVARSIDKAVR